MKGMMSMMSSPPKRESIFYVLLFFYLSCLACGNRKDGAADASGEAIPSKPAVTYPAFDQTRAFAHLEQQVGFGPRFPGSPGHEQAKTFLKQTLGRWANRLIVQEFTETSGGVTLHLTNIVGVITARTSPAKRVVLGAHWDTRPEASQESVPSNRARPIIGANDGASGVAILLEVAAVLAAQRPDVEVVIALFDGEDYGGIKGFEYSLGASRFVAEMELHGVKPDWMILIDMVGDSDLRILKEPGSTGWLVDLIWAAAPRVQADAFVLDTYPSAIIDDHVPFLRAGIPAVDLIDFDYPFWHRLDDTADKCSPASLKQVGDVLLRMVYQELK